MEGGGREEGVQGGGREEGVRGEGQINTRDKAVYSVY